MICTAEYGNSRYLFVVMSVESELSADGLQVLTFGNFVETRKLMNFAFNSYTVRQVLSRDQALYQYAVKNGENDVILHTQEDVYVLLPADYDRNAVNYQNRVDAVLLTAPITAGDKMGVLQITYGGLVLANCDLLAMNPVPAGESVTLTDERKPVSNKDADSEWDTYLSWAVLAAVIVAVFVAFVVLLVKGIRSMRIRRMNTVRARKRKRGR